MSAESELTRREFVRAGVASGAGLVLAFHLPNLGRRAAADVGEPLAPLAPFAPNAFLRIDADGTTTVVVGQSEMGQGVFTSLPMILAEELDADWTRVRVEAAPSRSTAGAPFANSLIGNSQLTVGSSSVRAFWLPLRKAGATARAMLISAAAAQWQVDRTSLRTESGAVIHPDGRRLAYGALTPRAAALPVPTDVPLKDPATFRIVGRSTPRLDLKAKVNGSATYGMDVRVPGMLTAVVARCPVFGGRATRHDATAAMRVPGVRRVLAVSNGVAVVADGYWAAKRGRDALTVEWDEGKLATLDSAEIVKQFAARAGEPGLVAHAKGDAAAALAGAAKRVEAVYELPYINHAPMEPMNATAHVMSDRCVVWAPTQGQDFVRATAARISGLAADKVEVHTTFLGGAFGRGVYQHCTEDALETSKAMGAPVQVIWSREDDTQHGYYRPASYHRLAAGLDDAGHPVAWTQTVVTPSVFAQMWPIKGVDGATVEGASDHPYAVANARVSWVRQEDGVPLGTVRSVGHSGNIFVVEGFIDELAAAAGADPYQYRRSLMEAHLRLRTVLDLAAEKAGWGTALPSGHGRGIGLVEKNDSYCAQVAEVSVDAQGALRVHRVVCAVDCGTVVNPDGVRAQMEGGIMFGLSAALGEAITIRRGRVEQSNFHDYPIMRIDAAPAVEVHIVSSREAPGGVGELAVPPIAAAVGNGIFAATRQRVRSLPFSAQRLGRA
jgi:isoquinoline 1-oxidoreductase beta subunit